MSPPLDDVVVTASVSELVELADAVLRGVFASFRASKRLVLSNL